MTEWFVFVKRNVMRRFSRRGACLKNFEPSHVLKLIMRQKIQKFWTHKSRHLWVCNTWKDAIRDRTSKILIEKMFSWGPFHGFNQFLFQSTANIAIFFLWRFGFEHTKRNFFELVLLGELVSLKCILFLSLVRGTISFVQQCNNVSGNC